MSERDKRSPYKAARLEGFKEELVKEAEKGQDLDGEIQENLAQNLDVSKRNILNYLDDIAGEEIGDGMKVVKERRTCTVHNLDPDQPFEVEERLLGNTALDLIDDGAGFINETVTRNPPWFLESCQACGAPICKFPSFGDPDLGEEISCPDCGRTAYFRCLCGRPINPEKDGAVKCRSCPRIWEMEDDNLVLQNGEPTAEPPNPIGSFLLYGTVAGATALAAAELLDDLV